MPDGLGRSFNLGGSGGQGGGGRVASSAPGGGRRTVSPEEVAQRARIQSRIDLLSRELPVLAESYPSMLIDLAGGELDDDAMMQGAFDAVGSVQIEAMVSELKEMPGEKQRGFAATMNPAKLKALQEAGWSPPQEKKKGGWDRLADVLSVVDPNPASRIGRIAGLLPGDGGVIPGGKMVAGALSKAATLPVVKQGLAAMDYVAEEAGRTQRVAPIMDSAKRLQDETGLSSEELMAETGIDTSMASGSGELTPGNLMEQINAGGGPVQLGALVTNPGDIFRAVKTWNAIGHEGSDDYLPEVQYEVFQKLEDEHGSKARDMLRYAKALASGTSPEDLADDEGITGDQVQKFVGEVAKMATTPSFKAAVSRLESGRVSFGRTAARGIWNDPTMNTDEGVSRYVSGAADAYFAVAADPTMVAGALSKSVKAARWGFRGEEGLGKLNRWQELTKVMELADEVGENAPEVTKALAQLPGRGFKAGAIRNHESALLIEGRAIAEPAKAVAKAFETGDFGPLVRQYPGFERSITDMKRFDAALKTAGEEGLNKPSQVFEFYKHAAFNRSVMNTIDDTIRIDVKSTKLFGHDGGGHLVVPHMTGTQRKVLSTRESFFNWRYELDPPPAVLKEAADEAAAEIDEAAGQLDNGLSALPDDPEFSALDEMVIDPDTAAYVRKPLPFYKEQLNKLIEVVTTPTTKRGVVAVSNDVAIGPEEFRALSENLGMMAGESKVTRLDRYNRFVNGNVADRHVLISQMIVDLGSATGMNMTEEGQAIIRKHIEHRNHIFGLRDQISRTDSGSSVVVRQALLEKHLADSISVPTFRDMLIATRKVNVMRQVAGTTRRSAVEAAMTRVWKPAQILRLGFPLRAGADEALQYLGRVGAREYVNRTVLEKWAGIRDEYGKLMRGLDGEVLRAPEGAIKPVRTFTRSLATISGVTDDALVNRAVEAATRNPEWINASPLRQKEMLKPYLEEAAGGLRTLPRTVRWIDDLSHQMAVTSSKWFHEHAISKVASRQGFAQKLLEIQPDYIKRVEANRLMLTHPFAQQGQMEMIGATFNGIRPGGDEELFQSGIRTRDATSPSGYQFIPTRRDGTEYAWVGHEDPSGFYNGLNQWMIHQAESPTSRAAWNELVHHVPQTAVDEIAGMMGVEGIDAVRAARDLTGELQPTLAAAVEWDAKTLRNYLLEQDADITPIESLLRSWDDLSEKSRRLITDPYLSGSKLTTDLDLAMNRAANAAYNEAYKLENASNTRSMIRAQTVDGRNVAEPLKDGHTRIYGAMLDRRSAEDIVRLLSDETMAQTFAERLNQHLADRNLLGEMKAVWDAAPPSTEGYDIATWVAGMKANIAQGSGSYIPATMAGSSNYAVAEAVRDALQDIMPEQMLKPTIGYLDHPDELFTDKFGMRKLTDSTVGMAPHHASTLRPIDPDNVVRQVHVELPDGTRMWLGENEIEGIAGKRARFDGAKAKKAYSTRGMTRVKNGEVAYNTKLIQQDYADGMKFLKGEGGKFRKEKADWGWDDPEYATKAAELDEVLQAYGLQDTTGLSLADLVGLHRTRQLRGNAPIPYQDVMQDSELWDDFLELAGSAKKVGKRTTEEWVDQATVDASKIVKAALDDLGVDLSGISAKQYQELLIARERAHVALGIPGQRPARTASKAAVEREADAMALALQMTRLSTDEKVLGRVRLALGKEEGYKILGEIWGTGVTEAAAVRKFSQEVLSEVTEVAIGKQSGEVMSELMLPLLRGEHRMDNLWNKVPMAELPVKSFGPTELLVGNNRWDKMLSRFFQGYAEPIIGAISRMPMFGDAFQKSLDTLRPVYDSIVHRGLNDEALGLLKKIDLDPEEMRSVNQILFGQIKNDKTWGKDATDAVSRYAVAANAGDAAKASEALSEIAGRAITVSDEELDLLKRWHLNQSNATEEWVHRSVTRAMEMVTPYVDDHRLRSALQEYIGPVFAPFYYAEEQFLRRFARGIYETPHMLRKGQLTMNGLRNLGMVRDDANGNEIFVIPGSELAMGVVADVAELVTGNEAMQILDQPLSMRTDFMIPGWSAGQSRFAWGPIVGLGTEYMTRRWPETEWRTDDPNRSWWEYVVPGPASGAYKAFLRSGDPTQLASAQIAAISYLEASGHALEPDATATEKEKYLENVNQVAKTVGILRYITGQVGFTGAAPVDAQGMIRKEFSDLLQSGLSYDDAITVFLEERGPEAMVYTVFGTENEVGAPLPNGTEAAQFMFENEDLIKNNPASAVWLIPEDKTDTEFDRRAFNQQLALGLRTRRSADELIDAVKVKEASEGYFSARDDYEAQRKVAVAEKNDAKRYRLDAEWSAWTKAYKKQHPVFAESFTGEGKERRQKTVEDLHWMLNAGLGGKQGQLLKPLIDSYMQFQREYGALKGESSKAAKAAKEDIFTDFFDEAWAYTQEHPETMGFWTSVIRPELPDVADDLETAKLGAAN